MRFANSTLPIVNGSKSALMCAVYVNLLSVTACIKPSKLARIVSIRCGKKAQEGYEVCWRCHHFSDLGEHCSCRSTELSSVGKY